MMLRSAFIAAAAICTSADDTRIPATSSFVKRLGRTIVDSVLGNVTLDWEGSSFQLTVVNATYVAAEINDRTLSGTRFSVSFYDGAGVYPLDSNGQPLRVQDFLTSPHQTVYYLSRGNYAGAQITYTLENLIEPQILGDEQSNGNNLTVSGFWTDGVILPAPAPASRRIEIIGDSITAGMGAAYQGPCGSGVYLNDYGHTYGHLLCANFSADCNVLAWSGIGMVCSYGPNCSNPGQLNTMPLHYPWTLGNYEGRDPWDFSSFIPDAVLINLGTNDFGFNRQNNSTFVAWYTSTYIEFVHNVTALYGNPALPVFLAVGSLTNDYATAVETVVAGVNAAGGNATFLDVMAPDLPIGCAGHPSPAMHMVMYEKARATLASVMGWD